MSKNLDLKFVKTKIYRTILEDGLLEVMMGIYLILSGVFLSTRYLFLNYLWLPIALVLIEVIRRRYVYPRSGYAKISLSTTEIVAILGAILVGIAILATLIALIASNIGHPVEGNWREIISYALIFLIIISFCFIAYHFSVSRWYLHGISMGVVFILSKALDAHGLVVALGVWITLVGMYVFLRLVNKIPLRSPETKENTNAS